MARRTRQLAHRGKVFVLLLILLAFGLDSSLANELSNKECNRSPLSTPIVSLAALYRQDIESSYLKSICEALKKHKLGSAVKVHKFPYGNEDSAFEILRNLLKDKNINMVLGPTDSGVFLRAIRELSGTTTAIISPLVTAKYPFDTKRLIFSTNVSIKKRTRTMAHTLAKYGLRSLVVLHSDSTFGQETEAAFREAYLQQKPESQYRPLQYNSQNFADDGPDLQIKQVLLDRPEGLGLFGTRGEIQEISKLLKEVNVSLTPYRPIIFTPIDFRPHYFEDYLLHTVSLKVEPKPEEVNVLEGDVEVLTHDTVLLLLDQLTTGRFKNQKRSFHNHLVDVLSGTPHTGTATLTDMRFTKGRNDSPIGILLRDSTGKHNLVTPPTFFDLVTMKITLLFETRGWWVIASLMIIWIIPILLSILDLKSWFRGSLTELLGSFTSWGFILFNFLVVGTLYFYLAETGRVPYDSPLTALIIAIGPTTFLKSTLFNTATGKAIGLSTLYGNSMKWLNRRLMSKRYQDQQKFINILSYYNSLASMKDELTQVYSHARTAEEKERLTAQIQQDIDRAETHLEKRIVCARHLFEEFRGFDNLKEFTPDEFANDDPHDPDDMIKAAVQNVRALTQPEQELIMKPIIENAQKVLEDRYKGEKVNFPKDKRIKVYHSIRFLVQYGFYGKNHLVSAKLLPENWGEEASKSGKIHEPSIETREGKSKLAGLVIHLKKRLTKVKTK